MKASLAFLILSISTANVTAQTLSMRIQDDGLFIFGAINKTPVEFMFDTGAGITVISSKLFNQLKTGLRYKGPLSGFRHDGERVDGDVYWASTLTVGKFTARNVPLLIWAALDSYSVDAILSLQPFSHQPVSLDFVHNLFIVETPETLAIKAQSAQIIPIRLDAYRDMMLDIFVTLQLDSKVVIEAELDTGTPFWNLLINPAYVQRLGIDSTRMKQQVYKQLPDGRTVYDRIYTIPMLSLQNLANWQVKNKQVTFREGLIYEGLIGAGLFKQHRLTIDLANKRLLITK